MLAYHVLPKKLPNSGDFPHWRQLWLCSIMLRMIPTLSAFAEPLTNAMLEFYRFTQDKQPQGDDQVRYGEGKVF